MKEGDKLYIVVREDLLPGQQAVQAIHAMRQFVEEHPEIEKAHFHISNYLCLLSVKNESELIELIDIACFCNIKYSLFKEPDLDNSITAIVFEPKGKKMLKNLKLALL